jgi:hypothetical protein
VTASISEALLDQGFISFKANDNETEEICQAFKKSFGTTSVSRYDRYAASRLLTKYNVKDLIQLIEILANHKDDKYCPVVSSIRQLEEKWIGVRRFIKTLTIENDIKV